MADNTTEQAAAAAPPVAPIPAPPEVAPPVEGVHYLTDLSDKLQGVRTAVAPAVTIAKQAYGLLNPVSTTSFARNLNEQVENKVVGTLTDANKFAETVQGIPQTGELEVEPLAAAAKDAAKAVAGKFADIGGTQIRPPSTPASDVAIKTEGPEWDRTHSAVDAAGKKVGSVGYKLDPDGRAQIYGSVVNPELRGKGVGQKLYRSAIEESRDAGASKITSDSTNTTPEANRVWEKLRDKGLPVENITHPNGKPGYQIDFDKPPESFSSKGSDFVHKNYLDPEAETDAMYHVTTAKDKVLAEGLKPRKETKTAGLGGGWNNQASDKISVTFDEGHASNIADRLRLASDAAQDKITPRQALDRMTSGNDFPADTPEEIGVALGAPEEARDEWENFDKWFDETYKPGDAYEVVQNLDDALANLHDDNEHPSGRVGLTASKQQMAAITPDQIAILPVEGKQGAKPEHIPDEMELRFDPSDIRPIKSTQISKPETVNLSDAYGKTGKRVIPPERSTGNVEHDEAIKQGGGIPAGMLGNPEDAVHVKMFHDPQTGTTLGLGADEPVTPEAVKAKILASRAKYAKASIK
jgi:ribosomal protein S18 acetylase RimI-like enzyme